MSENEAPYTLAPNEPEPLRVLRAALDNELTLIINAETDIAAKREQIAFSEQRAEELRAGIAKLQQDAR